MYTGEAAFVLMMNFFLYFFSRIGRAGRVGNTGRVTSFLNQYDDGAIALPFVRILTDAGQIVFD